MKLSLHLMLRIIPAFAFFLLIINPSCQKREFKNPYDEHLSPSDWAPYDLQIEDISITEKKLTWKCDAENIEGFRLDRKVGSGDWQNNYMEVGK
ncbi:MAG: hypothetical protein R6T99_10040, partial [Bacteroidales bacterium]